MAGRGRMSEGLGRGGPEPSSAGGFLCGQSCGPPSGSKNPPTRLLPQNRGELAAGFPSPPGFATASSCAGPRRRLSRDPASPAPKPLCLGVPGADNSLHTSLMAPPPGRSQSRRRRAENLHQPPPRPSLTAARPSLTRGHLNVLAPNHCHQPSRTPSSQPRPRWTQGPMAPRAVPPPFEEQIVHPNPVPWGQN